MRKRFYSYRDFMHRTPVTRWFHKSVIVVVGISLMIVGVILMPLPGPGSLIVLCGVAVLATEFVYAQRVLHRILLWWNRFKMWFKAKYLNRETVPGRNVAADETVDEE